MKSFFKNFKISNYPLLLLLFCIGLIYWYTKPPSILWIDSGTMLGASADLGIPNPPGFPFYMLATHVFASLPIFWKSSYLVRLETFTIVFSLLALYFVYKIVTLILSSNFYFHREATPSLSKPTPQQSIVAGFFSVLCLAFSYQYWSQSENTEAFLFTYFFLSLFIYLMLSLFVKKQTFLVKYSKSEVTRRYKPLVFKRFALLAFLYGLAAGANPTIGVFVPGVLFCMFLLRKYLSFFKVILLGVIFAMTLCCVYAYLPLRAIAYPFVNWGNPQTVDLFLGQLHGKGLNIYEPAANAINGFTGSPTIFFQSIAHFFLLLCLQFSPFLLPFLFVGLFATYKKNTYLFFLLLSIPLLDVIYAGLYFSGNQESWFIPDYIIAAIFLGIGFFVCLQMIKKPSMRFLLFLTALVPLLIWFPSLNRHNHYFASDYTHNLYDHLGENAIVIGTGDFFNSLGFYLHEADKLRTDVTPITANMLYVNRWYRDDLRHSAPNIVVSPKIDQIIQYKHYYEYNQAMDQFITDNIQNHPIYVAPLTLRASVLVGTPGGQLQLDPNHYKFVPHGLVLQVVPKDSTATPDMSSYDFHFQSPLTNPPSYLERNYQTGFKNIRNEYAYAWQALGDWYGQQGNEEKALAYYQKAKAINPNSAELLSRFGQYYGDKKQYDIARQYFEKSLRVEPHNATTEYNLALTYISLGNTQAALSEFDQITHENADPQLIQEALQEENSLRLQQQTAAFTGQSTLYDTLPYISLRYPNGWNAQPQQNGVILTSEDKSFQIALDERVKQAGISPQQYIQNQTQTFGTLVNAGLAQVPTVDFAYVKVWQTHTTQQLEFFLSKQNLVIHILVGPSNSSDMKLFDSVVESIQFNQLP